jgi:predicted component of type VI protein secretion system
MQLTMTVLRCPDAVTPETRDVAGGEFTVGRGPGVDWVLPDSKRLLSKRHFAVAFRAGGWQLADTSTNGTFLNLEGDPIGCDDVRSLHDGDRLRAGPYEIEVRLAREAARPAAPAGGSPCADPFEPAREESNPFDEPDHPSLRIDPIATQLRHDFDPMEPEARAMPFRGPTQAGVVADDGTLLAAFLEGAGMRDAHPANPPAMMLELGKAFRNLVAGLREVLLARARITSEFHTERAMTQARGTNPLTFAASDDDALAALLAVERHTDMVAHDAVTDALRDIRLHQLATMAAMQSAVRAMLAGLDPAKLCAGAEPGGGTAVLPAQRKARAWDAYEALHARTVQALAEDFDSVFGEAFARAYERSLHEVFVQERE